MKRQGGWTLHEMFAVLIGLGVLSFWGFIIWAIYRLVMHFTA